MLSNHPIAVIITLAVVIFICWLRISRKRQLAEYPPITFEEGEQMWLDKMKEIDFSFPVLYRDNNEVTEARGYESLDHLLSDYDTIAHDNYGISILIATNGKIVSLEFDEHKMLLFPNDIVDHKKTLQELLTYLEPVLKHMLSADEYAHVSVFDTVPEVITYLSSRLELK